MKHFCKSVALILCLLLCLTALPAMASELTIGAETDIKPFPMPGGNSLYYGPSFSDECYQSCRKQYLTPDILSSSGAEVRFFLRNGIKGLEFSQDHTKIIVPENFAGICQIAVTDATMEEIAAGPVKAAFFNLYIYPSAPKASLFCIGKNTVHVCWNPIRNASGYCIDYSYNSNMSGYQTIRIENPKAMCCDIRNLELGKQVYVRVRSYVTNEDGWWINGYDTTPKSIYIPKLSIWTLLDWLLPF